MQESHFISCPKPARVKNTKDPKVHTGMSNNRLHEGNPREAAFIAQWRKEQKDGDILRHLIGPYTARDAQVAATVIQWLGSNVGICFIEETIRRSAHMKEWLKQRFSGLFKSKQ